MSDGRISSGSSSSSSCSYCRCSDNDGESYSHKCESEDEDEKNLSFERYWEHNNEQSDVNREDIMKAAFNLKLASSDSEESIKRSFSDEDPDSVTEVTNNTTPSHVAIPPSDYDKPCLSSYFVPEKCTKARVRTFRKAGERSFKIEASSAINRRKKQFEIDRQNMIMLRKLREVKPVVVLPRQ